MSARRDRNALEKARLEESKCKMLGMGLMEVIFSRLGAREARREASAKLQQESRSLDECAGFGSYDGEWVISTCKWQRRAFSVPLYGIDETLNTRETRC